MTSYEDLREKHLSDAMALLPLMLERIEWSAERLEVHRRHELRRLVRVAKDLSPWHRKRLSGIDPDEVDESNLHELPVMTKDDLMANFDEIVTDDRLRLDVVEDHLQSLAGDAYLFDRYHACASGGSSGRRGVFVYDWEGWAVMYGSLMRYEIRARSLDPALAAAPPRAAVIMAEDPMHATSALTRTFSTGLIEWHRFPVTLPLDEIVAGLNTVQPTVLTAYASALYALVHEAREGRLQIRPLRILSGSEPLLPEIRAAVEETWGVPLINVYGTSEAGGNAVSCGLGPWLHLSDDCVVVEPVDGEGRPVPSETCSEKLYLTNLYNHSLPLIRYEITDQIRLIEGTCPCGSVHRRIEDPLGRLDDVFQYGDLCVHPHVFRSALSRQRNIVEYQVRQSPGGAEVAVRCVDPVDLEALGADIVGALAGLGLINPKVTVIPAEHLERQSSGKLRRFVPLVVQG